MPHDAADTEPALTLVIGNKNYSSWSLRAWLFMRHNGLRFDTRRIALGRPETGAALRAQSPSALVPVLIDGDLRIWDSLAICEYVSERYLDGRGWPADQRARAVARSACAEMHSGFPALRSYMPMNLKASFAWRHFNDTVEAEIGRIDALWNECHALYGGSGPWLFGEFSIADAFFAPVATRFLTYGVPLEGYAASYVQTLRDLPTLDAWYAAAANEAETLPQYEALEIWLA